jgi:ketosteroid isomerase-like protein
VRDSDVQAVRDSYEALNSGDIGATLAVLAPDAEWHESSELPDAGTFRGRDAVRAFLEDFLLSWELFHQEVEEVVVEGDRAALMIHLTARGRGSGAEVDARYAHVWTLRDGLGVRVDAYYDRDAALRAIRP